MYVCGYDVYIVMLFGVVKIIVEYRDELKGWVRFIF